VFSQIFEGGDFPEQFVESTWTPIFKKGDPQQCSNYRGLAVGGVLGKLYMSVLTRRLSNWANGPAKARHPAQAGFMRGVGTQHHQYIMRYLVTRHSKCKGPGVRHCKPLFVCQVDFAKAFDKVPRAVLWERLRERGIHGAMLEALKQSYEKVLLRPKVNGQVGEAFPCEQGVKQGDPLSPDLFGLYIEALSDFVDAMDRHKLPIKCPSTGVLLPPCVDDTPLLDGGAAGSVRLACLLFADDANLIALSSARMNYLLALLSVFCDAFGMTVNTTKSELLVFHPVASVRLACAAEGVSYRGQPLAPTSRARYLGLHYGPPEGRGAVRESLFTNSWVELLAAGKRATHALRMKLAACGLHIPRTVMTFYNTCVQAIYSFGAQVWSTPHLTADFNKAMMHPMVAEQRGFLQRIVGAQRPNNLLLYMELSQLPMQHHWAGLVFRFWNDLVQKQGSLCNSAFRSDIRLALEHGVGWAHDVLAFCVSLILRGCQAMLAFLSHNLLISIPACSSMWKPFWMLWHGG
jgi:hypothetical protein